MDSPYSPHDSPQHSSRPPLPAGSPALVPIPNDSRRGPSHEPTPPADSAPSWDPNYSRHSAPSRSSSHHPPYPPPNADPYYREQSGHYRDPYHGGGGGGYPEDWRHQGYDNRGYHYSTPHDPYYQHPPRDPYGYPPRDPYGPPGGGGYPHHYGPNYGAPPPVRDPYYSRGDWPSHHDSRHYPPPPPSMPLPSSAPIPPQSAAASSSSSIPPSIPVPISSTAVSLGPHPIYGHIDASTDLSIPILFLCRPISTKTFGPLKKRFEEKLELRYVNSLLELERDLGIVKAQDLAKLERELKEQAREGGETETKEKKGREKSKKRRRLWISAVGGTDSLVQRIWSQTEEKIEWKEIVDLQHLQLELLWEEKKVEELWQEEERAERGEDGEVKEEGEKKDIRDWEEQERGRREIEERESFHQDQPQVEELDRVLREVRGEKQSPRQNDHYLEEAASTSVEPTRLGTSRNGERGEVVVDRFEDIATRDLAQHGTQGHSEMHQEEAGHSRKRSRIESEETGQDQQQHSAQRAARKKLEAICKAPRRNCVEWARSNNVPVNEETEMVDREPVLGERHRGVWDLFGQELDEISPQIQVLMARTMRDITYPERLRLYSTPEVLEQLEQTVPWFTTLLKTIGDRYELAGAATIVPQDPPVAASESTLESEPTLATDAPVQPGTSIEPNQ
ncbi:uncharacterized protein JCM6883_004887 [Sporobolomyces salmoneus]|uniref:uncharacterized protein n=1 Tax=Sporobolomyces salmoneus TaxID=183962 RepID=UPI003181BE4D